MIQSVKKANDILLYLSNNPEQPTPLSKIADDLGLNKSTCAHLLDTLCESLMAERVSRRAGYRLGPNAYLLSRYGRYQESLIELCSPLIRWLRAQVDATVFLTVVCDGIKYIVFHEDSDEQLDIRHSEIVRGNIETTATGVLMMAYMDSESLDRVLRRQEKHDSTQCKKELESRQQLLKRIRSTGYAHFVNEQDKNHSFAFRVWDGTRTVASLGVLYPFSRDSNAMREKVIRMGKSAAEEISRRLMFKGDNTGSNAK